MRNYIIFLIILSGCTNTDHSLFADCVEKDVCDTPYIHQILVDTKSSLDLNAYWYIQPGSFVEYGSSLFDIELQAQEGLVAVTLEGTKDKVLPDEAKYSKVSKLTYKDITLEALHTLGVFESGRYITDKLGNYTFARIMLHDHSHHTGHFKVNYWEFGKEPVCGIRLVCDD